MKFITIARFFVVLIVFSCSQQPSKVGVLISSGLLIENGVSHGATYTDSLGTKYSLRYIPITMTNDSVIPIHIRIDLSNEYNHSTSQGEQKFKAFLLPEKLRLDKERLVDTITYELLDNELRDFLDKDLDDSFFFNKSLEPQEKYIVRIGTLYPNPTHCGIIPNKLLMQNNRRDYHVCESLENQGYSINSQLGLGIKLIDCDGNCMFIPCGRISFPEH